MNALELRRRTLGNGVYKKTVEGNPAIAQGSLARRYPGITMQGWTEQAQYEGKNIYNGQVLESKYGGSTIDDYLDNINTNSTTPVELEPSTNYTFSINEEVGYDFDLRFYDVDGNYISSSYSITFLTPDNTKYIIICGIKSILSVDYKIQIEKGTSATLYEPYTGGAPSPNPDYPQEIVSAGKYDEGTGKYEYELKLTGKNLIDDSEFKYGTYYGVNITKNEDGGIRFKGTGTSNTNVYIKRNQILKGGYYSLSCKYLGLIPTVKSHLIQVYSPKAHITLGVVNSVDNGTVITGFLKESDDYFIRLTIIKDFQYDVVYYPMMCIDRVGCVFEPYQIPQSVTLTSNRPLTKWDRLEKRNGVWGWVYKSDEVALDGSEDWEIYPYYGNCFIINDPTFEKRYESSFCDKYRNVNTVWTKEGIYNAYSDHPNNDKKYFKPPLAEVQTVEQWKTWLSENPLTLWYETAEETFVPLSESDQEAMNELYTFRPTTVLSNDCECEMTLTYKTKKSLEVTT